MSTSSSSTAGGEPCASLGAWRELPNVRFEKPAPGNSYACGDGGTVFVSQSADSGCAVAEVGFSEGKAAWTFILEVDSSNDETSYFGAARMPVTNQVYNTSPDLWMLRSYNGQLYHAGSAAGPSEYSASAFKVHPKDVVRIEYDCSAKTLSFGINGKAPKVLFTDVPAGLHPACGSYSKWPAIRLARVEVWDVSADPTAPPLPSIAATDFESKPVAAAVGSPPPVDITDVHLDATLALLAARGMLPESGDGAVAAEVDRALLGFALGADEETRMDILLEMFPAMPALEPAELDDLVDSIRDIITGGSLPIALPSVPTHPGAIFHPSLQFFQASIQANAAKNEVKMKPVTSSGAFGSSGKPLSAYSLLCVDANDPTAPSKVTWRIRGSGSNPGWMVGLVEAPSTAVRPDYLFSDGNMFIGCGNHGLVKSKFKLFKLQDKVIEISLSWSTLVIQIVSPAGPQQLLVSNTDLRSFFPKGAPLRLAVCGFEATKFEILSCETEGGSDPKGADSNSSSSSSSSSSDAASSEAGLTGEGGATAGGGAGAGPTGLVGLIKEQWGAGSPPPQPAPSMPPAPAAPGWSSGPVGGAKAGGSKASSKHNQHNQYCPLFLQGKCSLGSKCSFVHEDYKAVGPYSNSKEMEALAYANWSDYMRLDPSTLPFSEDLQAYYVASSSAPASASASAPAPASASAPAPASGSASVSAGGGVGADVKEAEGEGKTAALGPPLGPPSGPPLAVDPLAGDRQQLPVLMRLTTRGRDEELSLINSEYRAGLERLQDELDRDGILKPMDGLKAQHYYGRTAGESKESGARYKKVIREITRELYDKLSVESRGTMLIRFDADAPQFLRAVITGMDGTPYASGCFVFDIHVPPEYPEVSPKVIHVTPRSDIDSLKAPHSPGGFSPNLHRQGGKVCLSLLGTWDGPGWVSGQSNLYMVLAALQLQIFGAEHPYYMEPNYGGWEGTAPESPQHDKVNGAQALQYEEQVKYHTAWLAILEPLKKPPAGFEQAVTEHFNSKRKLIIATLDSWVRKSTDLPFKAKLNAKIDELLDEFDKVLTIDDLKREFYESVQSTHYLRKKQLELSQHLDIIGDELAFKKDADLRKKLVKLVSEGDMLLRQQQSLLARTRRRYFLRVDPDALILPVAPRLTKEGMTTSPPLGVLQAMTDKQLSELPEFTVTHATFGSVTWTGPVDVRGLDLDLVVRIARGQIDVYPPGCPKRPPIGQGLNRRAVLVLLCCPASRRSRIDEMCALIDAELVESSERDGRVVLSREHFNGLSMPQAWQRVMSEGGDDGDDDDEGVGDEGEGDGDGEGEGGGYSGGGPGSAPAAYDFPPATPYKKKGGFGGAAFGFGLGAGGAAPAPGGAPAAPGFGFGNGGVPAFGQGFGAFAAAQAASGGFGLGGGTGSSFGTSPAFTFGPPPAVAAPFSFGPHVPKNGGLPPSQSFTHKSFMKCACGHNLGPVDAPVGPGAWQSVHLDDVCKWDCCGKNWSEKSCVPAGIPAAAGAAPAPGLAHCQFGPAQENLKGVGQLIGFGAGMAATGISGGDSTTFPLSPNPFTAIPPTTAPSAPSPFGGPAATATTATTATTTTTSLLAPPSPAKPHPCSCIKCGGGTSFAVFGKCSCAEGGVCKVCGKTLPGPNAPEGAGAKGGNS